MTERVERETSILNLVEAWWCFGESLDLGERFPPDECRRLGKENSINVLRGPGETEKI